MSVVVALLELGWWQVAKRLEQLERYAEEAEEVQLTQACRIVRQHKSQLPQAAFHMLKLCKDSGTDRRPPTVLTTAHGAKGNEYPAVVINPDLAQHLGAAQKGGEDAEQEANIAYVAITRAQRSLGLPAELRDALSERWRKAIDRLDRRAEESHTPRGREAQRPRQVPSRTPGVRARRHREELPLRVGAAVQTTLGAGTIVEYDGGKALVKLDGGSATLREDPRNLKRL